MASQSGVPYNLALSGVTTTTAEFTWTRPTDRTGLQAYTIKLNGNGVTQISKDDTSYTFTGLSPNTMYGASITAIYNGGIPNSVEAIPKTFITLPDAPQNVVAESGLDSSTIVGWSAYTSGEPISYKIYMDGNLLTSGVTFDTYGLTGQPFANITGLTNGTQYSFTVVANNYNITEMAGGDSAHSSPPVTAKPYNTPGSPTNVTAVAGNGSAIVSFDAPSNNGGSAITSYLVAAYEYTGGAPPAWAGMDGSGVGVSSPITVSGLTNGVSYVFAVLAFNEGGSGANSSYSTAVTPTAPASKPDAPTSVSATAGNAQATVSFTPIAAPIGTSVTYTVTALSNGNPVGSPATGSGSPITVTGLTNGTAYTFTVKATVAGVDSDPSSPSLGITPLAPAPAPAPAPSGIPCFPAGVRIRTPAGEKPVESLKSGDLVLTAAGRAVPIRMHSYSLEATTEATAPYFIPAGAMGPKAPAKPLHLSPLHAFQIKPNVWWCAKEAAKVSPKIQQYGLGSPITYYHVECPNFLRDNLVADGVVVESFAAKQLTKTEKHNLYKFSKALGGFVRSNPTASVSATH